MGKEEDNTARIGYLERAKAIEARMAEAEKMLCTKKLEEFFDKCKKLTYKGTYHNRIGRRISHIRTQKNIPVDKICRAANISRSKLNRIEKGQFPKYEDYINIVFALECNVHRFVEHPDDTDKWIEVEKSIAKGENDELIDVDSKDLPRDIDTTKEKVFDLLDNALYTYKKNGKERVISPKHMELLRKQILNAFDTLDYLEKR